MLKAEMILHGKERVKVHNFKSYGLEPFKIMDLDNSTMTIILTHLTRSHHYKRMEKLMIAEVEYRTEVSTQIKNKTKNNKQMKKTILVIYTNSVMQNPGYTTRYAFNTDSEVEVGDMLDSPNYTTKMQVVAVLDKSFKYFNKDTGEMRNKIKGSKDFEIRELKVYDNAPQVIIATKVKKK